MDPSRDPFRDFFQRTAGPTRRAFSWTSGRSNPIERFFATLLVFVLGTLILVALIPLILVVALLLLGLTVYLRIRVWWMNRKKSAEADAGRENVRVIRRD